MFLSIIKCIDFSYMFSLFDSIMKLFDLKKQYKQKYRNNKRS